MYTWIPAFTGMTGCFALATDGILDFAAQKQAGLRCCPAWLLSELFDTVAKAIMSKAVFQVTIPTC
jgi:hypothetical protein